MATEAECLAFIAAIAPLIQKYAPLYHRNCASAIIAQACLESGYGSTTKAAHHNYFGLKYRTDGRVQVKHHTFTDGSQEQNADGSYTPITDTWYGFDTMGDGVIGYFQWTDIPHYDSCKNISDPQAYLEALKNCAYATSHDYVKNVMAVVKKWNLTQYDEAQTYPDDTEKRNAKMIINVHAGHNPHGKVGCGAVGYIEESIEDRKVKNLVIEKLRSLGHTVYDCTEDNGTGQQDILRKIVAKCNAHTVDLDVSIHFNAGTLDRDGNTTGTEVYIYNSASKAKPYAEAVVNAIGSLGFVNRGVKTSGLYVLRNTKAPAMLIECCFVDDKDDVRLYNAESMAIAIVKGITGQTVSTPASVDTSFAPAPGADPLVKYKVQCGAFSNKKNATALQNRLKKAGFETIMVTVNGLYKIQCGAYGVKENADALASRLKASGFDAIVVNV